MTKKDFIEIAGAVSRTHHVAEFFEKNQVKKQAKFETLRLLVTDMCATFKSINPRFDDDKFIKACGF